MAKNSEWTLAPGAAELCALNLYGMTLSDLIRFKVRHLDEMAILRTAEDQRSRAHFASPRPRDAEVFKVTDMMVGNERL
ncbi:hypothetical protein IQ782_05595 [Salipiger pacificus]|uniref:Uncharacterized protein n=1 Tax=Salipiger mangrovisoli TaxID=2865933 RepID=A0ABR9WYI0_9RHOB|nr:hypothetical protein [Salipiger mangrovisoli]